jgi:hypothetical protein
VSVAGCLAPPRLASSHSTPAADAILSAEQLQADALKNLPTENETGRIESLGDILQELAAIDPKDPELFWYFHLPAEAKQEVISELNHYHLVLRDNLLVKARLRDDYDMRWRFADAMPSELLVEGSPSPPGGAVAVQVTAEDLRTKSMPRTSNDQRSFNAHFVWKPDSRAEWRDQDLAGQTVGFTLPLHYSADCEIINRVPEQVEHLGAIESIDLLADGNVRMTVNQSTVAGAFTVRLALNGKGEATSVIAKAGDSVATVLVDALGAGASGYTYLGAYDGRLRFESFSWFYEIGPATRNIVEVLPYHRMPGTK